MIRRSLINVLIINDLKGSVRGNWGDMARPSEPTPLSGRDGGTGVSNQTSREIFPFVDLVRRGFLHFPITPADAVCAARTAQ